MCLYGQEATLVMTQKISLTRDKFAIVDDEDYEELNKYKWFCSDKGYARRTGRINKRNVTIYMHLEIMCPPDGYEVDHKDLDRLNNVRSNLRICSVSENSRNKGVRRNNTSGYKGVHCRRDTKKWVARIGINGIRLYLGEFNSAIDAASAYNLKAVELHKEFAILNTISNGTV